MKVDDIKPRKEKNIDSIENTCDDEIKYLQKDKRIHNEEKEKEEEDTQEDEEYFVLVPEIVLRLLKNKPTQSHKIKLSKTGF